MNKIGIITDDLTGTMTCGVLLASVGIKASSYFDPQNLENSEDQEAIIISAESRNLPPEQAKKQVKQAYSALKAKGATYFTKRIDTTFRGGMGFEVDALIEELPNDTIVIMAPAMPDTHRIVVGGYSIIDSTILAESAASRDVLSPVHESHIPTLISSQSKYKVSEIHIDTVKKGLEAIQQALEEKKHQQCKIIVIDALTTDHLGEIAKAVYALKWNVVCVDPGAFTQQLALLRGFGRKNRSGFDKQLRPVIENYNGKVVVIAGSATDVTRSQITQLMHEPYSLTLSINPLELFEHSLETNDSLEALIKTGVSMLNDAGKRVFIIETAVTNGTFSLADVETRYHLPKGDASRKINHYLGHIIHSILEQATQPVHGIYMTGGDTLVTSMKALGAAGIQLIDTVLPQTNLGQIIGGSSDGMLIVGKGGLIGNDQTVYRVIERLFYEATKEKR